jgi:hypothetical protein
MTKTFKAMSTKEKSRKYGDVHRCPVCAHRDGSLRSFWRGVRDGFASPMRLFEPSAEVFVHKETLYFDSFEHAWQSVDSALADAWETLNEAPADEQEEEIPSKRRVSSDASRDRSAA